MVGRVGKLFVRLLCCTVLASLCDVPALAHEQAIHRHLTKKAVDLLKLHRPADLPDTCVANLSEKLQEGADREDDSFPNDGPIDSQVIGRFYFHFMGEGQSPIPLNDTPFFDRRANATCNSLQWADNAGAPNCVATIFKPSNEPFIGPKSQSNDEFRISRAIADLQQNAPNSAAHNQALIALGRYLHLLQDLTSPAHVRNDAHPHKFGWGDPSQVEWLNEDRGENDIPTPTSLRALEVFTTKEQAFQRLRDWTVTNFRSEKDTPTFAGPGPAEAEVYRVGIYLYARWDIGPDRKIARLSDDLTPMIDAVIAREQFDVLAPEAIVYTASMLQYLMDGQGVRLCSTSIPGLINFEERAPGTILSRCTDGGTLPNCLGPNGVHNVYPGLTFYSTSAGPRVTGGGEVAVFRFPEVPSGVSATGLQGSHGICAAAATPSGVDCKINIFVKFAPGVTSFAYRVVGGYSLRGFAFDDFNGLIYYGPSGLQLNQSVGSMWRIWDLLIDRRNVNLSNITGFEFFTTNSHVDAQGLNGIGGLAIDEIQFTP